MCWQAQGPPGLPLACRRPPSCCLLLASLRARAPLASLCVRVSSSRKHTRQAASRGQREWSRCNLVTCVRAPSPNTVTS